MLVSAKDYRCFHCIRFLGTTAAGDVRCKKSDACLKVRMNSHIAMCKRYNWFKENGGQK